jgi:hypothetical protein
VGWFHRHEWVIVSKTYAPPVRMGSVQRISEHLAERFMAGVTTALLRCATCGDVKAVEMLGPEVLK